MEQTKIEPYKIISNLFKNYYRQNIFEDLKTHSPEYTLNSYQTWMSQIYERFYPNQLYGITALSRFLFNYWDSHLNLVLPHGISKDYTWSKEFLPGYPICTYSSYMEAAYLRGALKKGFDSTIFRLTFPPMILTKSNVISIVTDKSAARARLLVILSKDQTGVCFDQLTKYLIYETSKSTCM